MARSTLLRGFSPRNQSTASRKRVLIDQAEVARVAYELFQQRRHVHGHDMHDWLDAERIVRERHGDGKRS